VGNALALSTYPQARAHAADWKLRERLGASKIGPRSKSPQRWSRQILQDLIECGPSPRSACGPACLDEVSCRMFLCARCRSQVLVCRRCDRGQICCAGACAKERRRDRQREARRRYQATPRGRAMHAERNRRYRARRRRVTDHGPAKVDDGGPSPAMPVDPIPPSSKRPRGHLLCHHCGQPASPFLRLTALRPRRRRVQRGRLGGNGRQLSRPP